jgi:hypothetical protein
MSWAVRSCANSLATKDNLAICGGKMDTKCQKVGCSDTATLAHLLKNCQVIVNQGRYTHRHDSCLIYKTLKKDLPKDIEVYADLDEC